jgi:hypothetical protein
MTDRNMIGKDGIDAFLKVKYGEHVYTTKVCSIKEGMIAEWY